MLMDKLVMMTNHCDIIMQDLVVRINKSMTNYSFNVPRQFLRVCGRIANSSPRILPEAGDLLWRVGQHHLKVVGLEHPEGVLLYCDAIEARASRLI